LSFLFLPALIGVIRGWPDDFWDVPVTSFESQFKCSRRINRARFPPWEKKKKRPLIFQSSAKKASWPWRKKQHHDYLLRPLLPHTRYWYRNQSIV